MTSMAMEIIHIMKPSSALIAQISSSAWQILVINLSAGIGTIGFDVMSLVPWGGAIVSCGMTRWHAMWREIRLELQG